MTIRQTKPDKAALDAQEKISNMLSRIEAAASNVRTFNSSGGFIPVKNQREILTRLDKALLVLEYLPTHAKNGNLDAAKQR